MPTPLNETGSYMGYELGLGVTPAHLNNAPKIKNKNVIVMASIGASVQNQISERLSVRVEELENPKFKFVNLAQPAKDITEWLNSSSVWDEVNVRLASAGVVSTDVQIVWLQNDLLNTEEATFPSSPMTVKANLASLITKIKSKFPKLKQVFLTGRPYSGFSKDIKHNEPKGYYNSWACRWLVEDQINGLYPASPWLCDSIYMWTDGTNPREDGFSILESNYNVDGVHLSGSGKIKFGDYLFEELLAHTVSSKYFY